MRSSKRVILQVQRRCLVVEWGGQMDELEDADLIGAPCPARHSRTERIGVVRRRVALAVRNPVAEAGSAD
jgi:hypothetical protein